MNDASADDLTNAAKAALRYGLEIVNEDGDWFFVSNEQSGRYMAGFDPSARLAEHYQIACDLADEAHDRDLLGRTERAAAEIDRKGKATLGNINFVIAQDRIVATAPLGSKVGSIRLPSRSHAKRAFRDLVARLSGK